MDCKNRTPIQNKSKLLKIRSLNVVISMVVFSFQRFQNCELNTEFELKV